MKNPLQLLPDSVRLYVYVIAVVVMLALSAWQAADGDVVQALSLFVGSLVPGTAASNTGPKAAVRRASRASLRRQVR